MRLIKFESLELLNSYLAIAKNVKKVKLLTEGSMFKLKTVYYVLVDDQGEYQHG
jgi:hypothetical protein